MCHKKNELIRGLEQKAEKLLTLSGIEPRQHYENYRGLAGYVCVWVPPELFAAAGYHPFLLRSGKPLASLIKKDDNRCLNCIALESFFADEVPKDLKLLAVTNTCEHIQKTIRYITRDSEVTMFFIDEPEGQSEESLRKYHQQLSLLVDMITEGTDRDAFYSRLGKYLDEYGSLRTDLARIQLANKLPASVFFKLHAATQTAPMKPARELVDEAADVIEKLDEQTGKKVVLVGGLYGAHEWEIASMLEEAGLQVAADLLCTSGRDITPRTSTEDMPVFDRLVLDYFNRLPCMPSLPNKRFYNHLENLFVNRDVKGMIYIRPANCDSYDTEEERLHWSIDAPMLTLGDEYDQLHNEKLMRTLRDFAANL